MKCIVYVHDFREDRLLTYYTVWSRYNIVITWSFIREYSKDISIVCYVNELMSELCPVVLISVPYAPFDASVVL